MPPTACGPFFAHPAVRRREFLRAGALSLFGLGLPTLLQGRAVALHLLNRHLEASEAYRKLLARDARSEELLGNAISLAITMGLPPSRAQ